MPSGRLSETEVVDQVQTLFADPAAAGDNQIAGAPGANFKWVVYGYQIIATGGANNVRFKSGANNKTSLKGFAANAGISVEPSVVPLFECNENEALNINLSAATAVGVDVQAAKARV